MVGLLSSTLHICILIRYNKNHAVTDLMTKLSKSSTKKTKDKKLQFNVAQLKNNERN